MAVPVSEWIEGPPPVVREPDGTKSYLQPGTLIEVDQVELWPDESPFFLVGHINDSFGVCNDCTRFDRENIIRHKIVWTPEDEK